MFGKPVENPDEKASRDVYGKRPERKRSGKLRADKPRQEKAANSAEKAATADQKNRTNHVTNLKTPVFSKA